MADPKKKKKKGSKKAKGNPGNPGTKGKKKKAPKKALPGNNDPRTAMLAQMAMAGAVTGMDLSKALPGPSASAPRPTAAQVAAMQKLTQDNTGLADRLKQITGSNSLEEWAAYFKQLPQGDMEKLVEWGRADTGTGAKDDKPGLLDKLLAAWKGNVSEKDAKAKEEEEKRKRTQTWIIIGAAAFTVLLLVVVLVMNSGKRIV